MTDTEKELPGDSDTLEEVGMGTTVTTTEGDEMKQVEDQEPPMLLFQPEPGLILFLALTVTGSVLYLLGSILWFSYVGRGTVDGERRDDQLLIIFHLVGHALCLLGQLCFLTNGFQCRRLHVKLWPLLAEMLYVLASSLLLENASEMASLLYGWTSLVFIICCCLSLRALPLSGIYSETAAFNGLTRFVDGNFNFFTNPADHIDRDQIGQFRRLLFVTFLYYLLQMAFALVLLFSTLPQLRPAGQTGMPLYGYWWLASTFYALSIFIVICWRIYRYRFQG